MYFINELIKKSGAKDKFDLTRLAIKKARQLLGEKDKRALLNSTKLATYVLEELQEGGKLQQEQESQEQEKDNKKEGEKLQ